MEFNGALGCYRFVLTEDNTYTLWSEKFDENCHSLGGATEETKYIYLEGCKIKEKAKGFSSLNILEIGYGAGVGLECTVELIRKYPRTKLNYFSLELDPVLISCSRFEFKKRSWNSIPCFYFEENNMAVYVLIGDARKTVKKLKEKYFHAIYQDPFSPRKNPELWTDDWFDQLMGKSHPRVHLSTFSSSPCVRESLKKTGWHVIPRAGFKYKKASTVAVLPSCKGRKSV